MKRNFIFLILLAMSFALYANESLTADKSLYTSDYLNLISQFDANIKKINLERVIAITKAKEILNAEKLAEKATIDNIEIKFTETKQHLEARKENLYKELEAKYKTYEANKIAEINNKYDSLIQIEEEKKKVLTSEF